VYVLKVLLTGNTEHAAHETVAGRAAGGWTVAGRAAATAALCARGPRENYDEASMFVRRSAASKISRHVTRFPFFSF
jgi:hypothetical protein